MQFIKDAARKVGTVSKTLVLAGLVAIGFAIAPADATCYACDNNGPPGGGTLTTTIGMSGVAEVTRMGDNFAGAMGDRANAWVRQGGETNLLGAGVLSARTNGCPGGCGTNNAELMVGGRVNQWEVGGAHAHSAGHGLRTAETSGDGRGRITLGLAATTQVPQARSTHR
jgi:hypothetical protein